MTTKYWFYEQLHCLIDIEWNKEFNFDTFEFKPLDDRFKRVHSVYLSFV